MSVYRFLYFQKSDGKKERNQQTVAFYQFVMEKGVLSQLNPYLLVQQQQLFEALFNVKFLMQNQLTVEQTLWFFYYIQSEQLLFERYRELLNDEVMKPKMAYLANKVTILIF
ncbi:MULTISPECIES: hypothetical protein [unclassified Sporosarcina]|uniref:hypothetical protein n=1 Tax=unclassified Sporosarcina TaxID=2647733 RepID=UPI000C166D15|nr:MULTISPECIES: hypothetical protein [unclassified Sporosarcina]PID04684.1 hypothetical protein CSV66_13910 [Sporosarcina sp. P30]PID07791.1 hypothetical protein CSV65_14350 [Sporosarcina sp. P31]PID11024.1 hypothetical protein CSV64_14145 [Sporosarcina sp. P32b]